MDDVEIMTIKDVGAILKLNEQTRVPKKPNGSK